MGPWESDAARRACFVAIPFERKFQNAWDLAIAPAIRDCGLIPWRGDNKEFGANIVMKDITRAIHAADLMIADISDSNPSVMYELGLAHAAKKHTILIARDASKIPFDISHIRVREYDSEHLRALRDELVEAITAVMALRREDRDDHFPELRILDSGLERQLNYLQERAISIEVSTNPSTLIFFNDRIVGDSPQAIRVNPDGARNTVSAALEGFIEHYQEISAADLEAGTIRIDLKRLHEVDYDSRVARWLRFRRRDPDNAVLMRGISSYLLRTEHFDEAQEENRDLIAAAPDWYLAHNQFGYGCRTLNHDQAIRSYGVVVALRPGSYLGYFNLACQLSRVGRLEEAMSHLREIAENQTVRESMFLCRVTPDITTDDAFKHLAEDPQRGPEFRAIATALIAAHQDWISHSPS